MENKKYDGTERREALRVSYEPDKRPILTSGEHEFEIADVSEMGLRFFNEKKINLGNWVKGTVTLLCGESIDVYGMVVRVKGIDIYMNVNNPIQKEVLIKEQHISNNCD